MFSLSIQETVRRLLSLKSTNHNYIELEGGTAGLVVIKNNLFE